MKQKERKELKDYIRKQCQKDDCQKCEYGHHRNCESVRVKSFIKVMNILSKQKKTP